ncbi:MAG: hypothetical protein MI892_15970 [Desulfobacterales bacterium]|nr:hypothetical protein [Desulfobacterales bacterium]
MSLTLLLKIGGFHHLLCAILHVVLPKSMAWNDILIHIPTDKRPLVEAPLKIMNWCLGVFWLILAYIPIFHSRQMLDGPVGKSLLFGIVIFWLIRIFVLQPIYMGIKEPISKRMIAFFSLGLILFLLPLIFSI